MKLRRKVVYPILPLAFVVLFAAPTPAHALGDWIGVEGAFWHNSQSGSASIDGDVFGGTSVDFQDTLDLDRTDNSKMGRVWFHWGKSRLFLDYFDASRKGSTTLTQSFFFNDTLYTAGQVVASDLDVKLLQAQYRFTLADLKLADVSLGLVLNQAKVNMQLDNGLPGGRTTFDKSVPYPTVAAAVTLKPVPGFHIRVEANGVKLNIGGTRVSVLDARAQAEVYVAHVLGFFAGYRTFHMAADDKDFGSVDNTFKGPYAGLGLKF
ncbi:MAG: hypothetical protein AUI47_07565 [Acidobacteria bacterium 13_1_40CM_2_68_5]|nr:MAG: hypothetical protein AUI47_07565 [Acidobacteria bacterium 13_1_40CM_2_68_5]OLE66125.1 MAG: hypothetical protein AUG03_01370 [Acidobacteria bacterium 13_1_20CM_2_68_14]